MEQIDLSTLAGDMFNMLVPESVSSKVSSLRMKLPRKTASISNLKNAPPPPPQSRRRSASTSISAAASNTAAGRTYAETAMSASGSAESLISEAESNATTLYASSSTSSSTRTSLQQYYPPPPQYQHYPQQQQYGAPLAPVLEEQHLKLMQQAARKQMAREERLAAGGESHESRWSPSGVKWRYARQGQHLTAIASEELDDASFERRSYIDGVAYYLRACPDNLNELETDILLRSAPFLAERPRPTRRIAIRRPTDRGKTFLHRGVQQAVALAMVAIHAIWCAVLLLGRVGVRYERQYNLSSQLVAHGYWFANSVGKHSVHLSARLQKAGDGKVGQIFSGLVAWTMESFTGGIQDGYGDGMVMIQGQTGAARNKAALEQEYLHEHEE
ncbi:hypothetical protein PG993_002957 [Apiospora rasikravindrae]|uniref:Uncharacterized protein n=1 Tax=Apiospora rasikravindrae TaxID=990691 RepID=A0ABR1TY87_9PEZI